MTVLRVCLINPPIAAVRTPSMPLTQLRSVLARELGEPPLERLDRSAYRLRASQRSTTESGR